MPTPQTPAPQALVPAPVPAPAPNTFTDGLAHEFWPLVIFAVLVGFYALLGSLDHFFDTPDIYVLSATFLAGSATRAGDITGLSGKDRKYLVYLLVLGTVLCVIGAIIQVAGTTGHPFVGAGTWVYFAQAGALVGSYFGAAVVHWKAH